MKSPAVLAALKAMKKRKPQDPHDLPEGDSQVDSERVVAQRVGWPRLRKSFLLIRGKLFPPTNPEKGELNHEA